MPRLAPGVVGASQQADAVYAANPDGGTVVSVHVDTGRCSRTAGRGRSTRDRLKPTGLTAGPHRGAGRCSGKRFQLLKGSGARAGTA